MDYLFICIRLSSGYMDANDKIQTNCCQYFSTEGNNLIRTPIKEIIIQITV